MWCRAPFFCRFFLATRTGYGVGSDEGAEQKDFDKESSLPVPCGIIKKETVMGPNPSCTCPEQHEGHICELTLAGDMTAIEHVTNCPTVVCEQCGIEANSARYVCAPEHLVT